MQLDNPATLSPHTEGAPSPREEAHAWVQLIGEDSWQAGEVLGEAPELLAHLGQAARVRALDRLSIAQPVLTLRGVLGASDPVREAIPPERMLTWWTRVLRASPDVAALYLECIPNRQPARRSAARKVRQATTTLSPSETPTSSEIVLLLGRWSGDHPMEAMRAYERLPKYLRAQLPAEPIAGLVQQALAWVPGVYRWAQGGSPGGARTVAPGAMPDSDRGAWAEAAHVLGILPRAVLRVLPRALPLSVWRYVAARFTPASFWVYVGRRILSRTPGIVPPAEVSLVLRWARDELEREFRNRAHVRRGVFDDAAMRALWRHPALAAWHPVEEVAGAWKDMTRDLPSLGARTWAALHEEERALLTPGDLAPLLESSEDWVRLAGVRALGMVSAAPAPSR